MTIADRIRLLADDGMSVAEIARKLGIRYQHAYNVLNAARYREGKLKKANPDKADLGGNGAGELPRKPPLQTHTLVAAGFECVGRWSLSHEGQLVPDRQLPKFVGVYAFARDGVVLYVGIATMGLAKRLYFYGRPGVSQRTSLRLNALIKNELSASSIIEIFVAAPSNLEWNGLPVHGGAGLEMGLIKKYALPWNVRGVG